MTGKTSNRLKEKKELILSRWEERSVAEVPSAETAASLVLRNSLPLYLDHLSEALDTNRKMDFRSVLLHDRESIRIGKLHGADRAGNTSYVLGEVIFEYHILREIIFQVLETEGPLSAIQRDIILDSIEQAVNDAAVKFSEVHAEIQDRFIHTLTHDLKNPLTAAMMQTQLILRRSNQTGPEKESARNIMSSLNRVERMVHDLLDANRIRAGEKLSLQFAECNLATVVREVVAEMTLLHGDRFLLNSPADMEGFWNGDSLTRALENLIDNAVKYSPPKTRVTISLSSNQSAAELTVHNEGSPIAKEDIPKLFQPHRRLNSPAANAQGWGLGLTLVKGVLDAHEGKIQVESEPGKGTSFVLQIPFGEDLETAKAQVFHT